MNPQVSMAMNAMGGPVGGMPMMKNGAAARALTQTQEDSRVLLNTYIYDYLLKNNSWDLARSFQNEMPIKADNTKLSPGRRDVNGADDAMDTDSKEDVHKPPEDLPRPQIPESPGEMSFLLEWWNQFWDIFQAARNQGKPSQAVYQYLNHTQQNARMRNDQHHRMLMQAGNVYNRAGMMGMQQNGMPMSNELQRKAIQNNRNPNQAQLAQIKNMQQQQQQHMMQTQMQRDGSGMDMSGQRPQSPSAGENAPSPTKRPRLENNAFNGQPMGPGGRSQPMPSQQVGATSAPGGQMLLQDSINPNTMPQNFNAFQQNNPNVQAKSIEVYTQSLAQQTRSALNNQVLAKATNPGGMPQGSPMVMNDPNSEMFNANGNPRLAGPPGAQQGGNHALQDYQMQLMLLEQQNKKRLLMARQEQDNLTSQHPPGSVPMGQPGIIPATMSPSGSRAGPSPNPNDQIKRGTPKMGQSGLPGSPMPDANMQRASPIPNGFGDPNQMPAGMPPNYGPYPMGNPGLMRPPSSNPGYNNGQIAQAHMEAIQRNQQHRVQNGVWPQAPPQMMQQAQGQPPAQMGTPQQRSMPPPPAPQQANEAGRQQPPSPSQTNAQPPTPSQANKPNPKQAKKEKQEARKKQPANKKGAPVTSATPASEAEPPPTPTPSTPITPMHPQSFNQQTAQKNGAPASQAANAQPTPQAAPPAAAPAPQVQPPPAQMDTSSTPFGNDLGEPQFNMDFGPIDSQDVLENFDFDSFLNHNEDYSGFPTELNFSVDGVETGTGDV